MENRRLMNEMGEQDVDGDILSGEMPDLPIEAA